MMKSPIVFRATLNEVVEDYEKELDYKNQEIDRLMDELTSKEGIIKQLVDRNTDLRVESSVNTHEMQHLKTYINELKEKQINLHIDMAILQEALEENYDKKIARYEAIAIRSKKKRIREKAKNKILEIKEKKLML